MFWKKFTNFNYKNIFIKLVLVISFAYIIEGYLITKHQSINKEITRLEKEYDKLALERIKFQTIKYSKTEKVFKLNKSHLKKISIKDVPIIKFN